MNKIVKTGLKAFFGAAIYVISMQANAQQWQEDITDESNFYSVKDAFERNNIDIHEGDGDDKRYRRWEYIMAPRVYPTGEPLAPDILYKEWEKYLKQNAPRPKRKKDVWTFFGPINTPDGGGGNGRINCIVFDPFNKNIIWAGTPAGGLWRTTDAGKSWSTTTDLLPNLGVTDIAINPQNPLNMFIATGDGYGYSAGNGNFWGGTYSMGVLKSTDGGANWKQTTLNWERHQARQVHKLFLHPTNNNLLIATTNIGIMRSTDAGENWTNVKTGAFKDIKMHPSNPARLYASGSGMFYSNDTGKTWLSAAANVSTVGRGILLAVTPAADSLVYALVCRNDGSGSLFISRDSGVSFELRQNVGQTTLQGWYGMALAVSPVDPQQIYIGGVDILKSTDGGLFWSAISNWYSWPATYYVHADHRILMFHPDNANTIISGNDGGIFISENAGATWKDISSNIQALQLYRIGSSRTINNTLFAGAQDNGVNRSKNGAWDHVLVGDGMECIVSHENPQIVYAATQYGRLGKSYNGGIYFSDFINPAAGNWTTPIEMDPNNAEILYFGTNKLYKTVNGGQSWQIANSSLITTGRINLIALTPQTPNTIYISYSNDNSAGSARLYRTNNAGTKWTKVTTGLPTGTAYLSGISVDPNDSNHVWVTFSGYNAANKVFETTDGGTSWQNRSEGLPNVPANCVVIENSVENGVYIGTDVGVFYRNNITTGWQLYNDGLPHTMVTELEILTASKKIRAATYGRGIWDGELAGTLTSVTEWKALEKEVRVYPNPSNSITYIELPENASMGKNVKDVSVFDALGRKVWIANYSSFNANGTAAIDVKHFKPGVYMVNIALNNGVISKKFSVYK